MAQAVVMDARQALVIGTLVLQFEAEQALHERGKYDAWHKECQAAAAALETLKRGFDNAD